MSDMPAIDVRPDQWAIIKAILARYVPHDEVIAFGSRARWSAKPFSDLDLAIRGQGHLSLSTMATLEHEFAESDLPFRVDVVDWHGISDSFRRAIAADQITVQPLDGAHPPIAGELT